MTNDEIRISALGLAGRIAEGAKRQRLGDGDLTAVALLAVAAVLADRIGEVQTIEKFRDASDALELELFDVMRSN